MSYPGLAHDDHRILGSDLCSGFVDIYGKWNTGFYCPQHSPTIPVFCCGTTYYKYCCVERPDSLNGRVPDVDKFPTEEDDTPFTIRIPVFFAVFCGIVAVIILLVTAICFFCSCCVVYKKRRGRDNGPFGGLYHIQGSSSTTSALTSIYSTQNSNNSVVSTPLDCSGDWGGGSNTFLPNGYIPYPYLTPLSNNSPYVTPSLTSSSGYPSSLTLSGRNHAFSPGQGHINNNNLSFYNNLNNNGQNRRNQNFSSLSSIYEQDYQQIGDDHPSRPCSVLSSYSNSTSMSTLPPPRGQGQGSYHVTNLRASPSYGPPPAYSFRPISVPGGQSSRPPSESLQLQESTLQQLLSLQSNAGGVRSVRTGNVQQQQTRFINQHHQQQGPQSNTNSSLGESQANLNLRQILLEREPQSRSRLNCSRAQNGNNGNCSHPPLTQQERLSLATIQSLIAAYRNNCGGQTSVPGLQPQLSPRPPSLTTADVNRLNAINLLVTSLLNQRQNGGVGDGESRRVLVNGESAPSHRSRPLLALLDGVIRASSSSPISVTSGSGGESSTTTTNTGDRNTSGLGESVGCSSTSGGESCGSESDIGLGNKNGAGGTINCSDTKIMDIPNKNLLNQSEESKEIVGFGSGNTISDDDDYDKIEKQIPIIQIIEENVPCQETESCFDLNVGEDDKEQNEDKGVSQNDQDYIRNSSFEDGKDKEGEEHDVNLFKNEGEEEEQSELSLEEANFNLGLGSEQDCCYEKIDVNLKDGNNSEISGNEKSHLNQETSVIIDMDEMSEPGQENGNKETYSLSQFQVPNIQILPQVEQVSNNPSQ